MLDDDGHDTGEDRGQYKEGDESCHQAVVRAPYAPECEGLLPTTAFGLWVQLGLGLGLGIGLKWGEELDLGGFGSGV